ncbi:MAG: KpsF/GutQ family sugar-phosphate isomerase [Planctomycetia bacterium]|nr:KpsF/GutQ family sugar-phosphate isomerase [Planctomycetia bacterium]
MDAARQHEFSSVDLSPFEQLSYARQILRMGSQALEKVSERLDLEFCRAVERLHTCRGSVVVSGIGKAGLVGQKLSATLASTGTRSFFLHPAEAVHGDLGRLRSDDVALVLSQSGETEEVVRLLPSLAAAEVPIVAMTARSSSRLGRAAEIVLELGPLQEACPLGLAPSTSTTAMLGLGDALALVTSRMHRFGREDFARVHPAGALGRRLSKVEERMRPVDECRVASDAQPLREVFAQVRRAGRRSGAVMLVDAEGALSGLFTDSDLARLFESRRYEGFDLPMSALMTKNPTMVVEGTMLADAVAIMADRKFSELPVVDRFSRPIGLLDVTDLVEMIPDEPR